MGYVRTGLEGGQDLSWLAVYFGECAGLDCLLMAAGAFSQNKMGCLNNYTVVFNDGEQAYKF